MLSHLKTDWLSEIQHSIFINGLKTFYAVVLVSLWLNRNNEILSRDQREGEGRDWAGVRVIYQTLNTDCGPRLWSQRWGQSWFGSSDICNRDFCTPWCQAPLYASRCSELIFILQWNGLLYWIGYWVEPCFIPASRHPRWSKKVCQFYNLRIKFVPDLWADNKLIILSQDLPSCQTQNSLILCHY